jgi:hypothetical protein
MSTPRREVVKLRWARQGEVMKQAARLVTLWAATLVGCDSGPTMKLAEGKRAESLAALTVEGSDARLVLREPLGA